MLPGLRWITTPGGGQKTPKWMAGRGNLGNPRAPPRRDDTNKEQHRCSGLAVQRPLFSSGACIGRDSQKGPFCDLPFRRRGAPNVGGQTRKLPTRRKPASVTARPGLRGVPGTLKDVPSKTPTFRGVKSERYTRHLGSRGLRSPKPAHKK